MNTIEILGVVTGIAAVYLLYKNNINTWPVGFINIVCFMWMFWKQKLYGDFIVQLIFLTTGIWGWANWNKSTLKIPDKLTNQKLNQKISKSPSQQFNKSTNQPFGLSSL